MKKREFIEMTLKTVIAILASFIAIILMEGMIYSIELNSYMKYGIMTLKQPTSTIAYCIERGDDEYFVLYYNEDSEPLWTADAKAPLLSKADCLAMEGTDVKEVVFHAPNAFQFSISGIHFVVMAVFVALIAGFFVYKFIALGKEYKKIEENFRKTGTIEINNI